MKNFLVVGGFLVVGSIALVIWLLTGSSRIAVRDVRQVETLVLGKEKGNPYTHGITIRGLGEVKGEATITLLLHGEPYKVAKLSGKVDFEWRGDWYSETAEIRYEPTNVRSGNVVLHYRFHQ